MSQAVHKVTHAVHHVVHGVEHVAKEMEHHPLETLGLGAGASLLIPGNPLTAALGLSGSSASTSAGAAKLATMGSIPDTALGAASATGATTATATTATTAATAATTASTLSKAAKIANIAGAGTSLLMATRKPKISIPDIPQQVTSRKAKTIGTDRFFSLLGGGPMPFGLTKTNFAGGSFGTNVSLGDRFTLL